MEKLYEIWYDERLNEIVIEDRVTGATIRKTVADGSQNNTILAAFKGYFEN